MRFRGKRALVLHACRGVGRAVAVLLAREGAHVALHHAGADPRVAEDALAAAEVAAAGGEGEGLAIGPFAADLDGAGLEGGDAAGSLVDAALKALGGLDVLVCAPEGGAGARALEGVARAAGEAMLAPPGRGGAIVLVAEKGHAEALGALVRSLAKALAPRVRVNAALLGAIDAPGLAPATDGERSAVLERTLLGRTGRPEEAARAILAIASDDCSYVTAQALVVDGGA